MGRRTSEGARIWLALNRAFFVELLRICSVHPRSYISRVIQESRGGVTASAVRIFALDNLMGVNVDAGFAGDRPLIGGVIPRYADVQPAVPLTISRQHCAGPAAWWSAIMTGISRQNEVELSRKARSLTLSVQVKANPCESPDHRL